MATQKSNALNLVSIGSIQGLWRINEYKEMTIGINENQPKNTLSAQANDAAINQTKASDMANFFASEIALNVNYEQQVNAA